MDAHLVHLPNEKCGWIYVLYSHPSYFKIGRATTLNKRIKQIAIQLPFPVVLVHYWHTDNAQECEALVHEYTEHCRMNGEWFNLSDLELHSLIFTNWGDNPRSKWTHPEILARATMAGEAERLQRLSMGLVF